MVKSYNTISGKRDCAQVLKALEAGVVYLLKEKQYGEAKLFVLNNRHETIGSVGEGSMKHFDLFMYDNPCEDGLLPGCSQTFRKKKGDLALLQPQQNCDIV